MRILVTGCSGFVGSFLARRLVERSHELFCVVRSGAEVPLGQAVPWDAAETLPESSFPRDIDVVIHLAQSRKFRSFPADAPEMFGVNVRMTAELLNWAARTGVKQFVLMSSGSVYEPCAGRLHESAPLAPNSFLGATKLASEVIARPYANAFKLCVLRLFFPYGPGQSDRLIPDLIRRVRTGQAIQISQDGEGLRFTPTFIDDVTAVVSECVEKAWTGTFNISSAERISIKQATALMGDILQIAPIYEPVKQSAGFIDPDISKLAEQFDVNRFKRFEAGLRTTIAASTAK